MVFTLFSCEANHLATPDAKQSYNQVSVMSPAPKASFLKPPVVFHPKCSPWWADEDGPACGPGCWDCRRSLQPRIIPPVVLYDFGTAGVVRWWRWSHLWAYINIGPQVLLTAKDGPACGPVVCEDCRRCLRPRMVPPVVPCMYRTVRYGTAGDVQRPRWLLRNNVKRYPGFQN